MNEKLRILMQSENLTASKLAEILEIKPAAVSHILSGRNKPSFDLLCKIVNRFPQINPYWLLGDAKEIYNTNAPKSTADNSSQTSGVLFDFGEETKNDKGANSNTSQPFANLATRELGSSDIEKIIIVYRDQTYEVLRPKNIG